MDRDYISIYELKSVEDIKEAIRRIKPQDKLIVCKEGRICREFNEYVPRNGSCFGCICEPNFEIKLNLQNIGKKCLDPSECFLKVIDVLVHESIHQALILLNEGEYSFLLSHYYDRIAGYVEWVYINSRRKQ